MRALRFHLVIVLAAALLAAPVGASSVKPAVEPTIEQLIGAKLVVVMSGTTPTTSLLGRVRRGEIGGVVLLGSNVTTRAAMDALTHRLQAAAATGGQPPLLIAIDQEGGTVKRIPWAPPTITVPEMGRIGSSEVARTQGRRTGEALGSLGINVDLAPVADIPRSSASFMYQQGRTFSFSPARTTRLANAFASGLADAGTISTMKHFPGIGRATANTDRLVATIGASRTQLEDDLRPYRRAIARGIPMIMLSNADYPALDPDAGAGWSRAIASRLLRDELGFTGVSITDSLNGTAAARGATVKWLALRAAAAGTDMLLVTGSEASTAHLHAWLVRQARLGRMPLGTLRTSYARIVTLRSGSSVGTPADVPVLPASRDGQVLRGLPTPS